MREPIHILVIEDATGPGISRVLTAAGHQPAVVKTGAAGLAAIRATQPDLVLLDFDLPDASGPDICREIKSDPALAGTFVVIAAAAHQLAPQRAAGLPGAADGFIIRPVDDHDLSGRIEAFARMVRLRRTLRQSEARFAAFMEYLPAAAFIKEHTGRILFANPYLQELMGWQDWEDHSTHELVPDAVGRQLVADDMKALEQGTIQYRETLPDTTGALRTFETTKFVIRAEGTPPLLGGIAMDITERKRAEEALEDSRALLVNLAAHVPGMIYQYRLFPDGRASMPYASAGIEDLYEVTPAVVCDDAAPAIERIHPDDRERVLAAVLDSAMTLQVFSCEFRAILPRQGVRWHLSHGKPERMADGGTLWHGIITDVTARKQAEETQREREFWLNESQRVGHLGSYVLDIVAETWNSSAAMDDIFGIEPHSEKTTASWYALVHPAEREELKNYFLQSVLAKREPFDKEYRIIRPSDGETRWLWGRGELNYDAEGNPVRMFGTIQDVTERKRAEDALRLTRFSIDHASVAVFWTAADGRIVDVNEEACRSLGYSREELLTMRVSDIDPDYPSERWPEHFATLRQCGSLKFETWQRTKDGRIFPGEIVSNYVWFGAEEFNCAFVRDISLRRQAEAKQAEHLAELRRWYDATIGREQRVLELKQEVNSLLLQAGAPARYASTLETPDPVAARPD